MGAREEKRRQRQNCQAQNGCLQLRLGLTVLLGRMPVNEKAGAFRRHCGTHRSIQYAVGGKAVSK